MFEDDTAQKESRIEMKKKFIIQARKEIEFHKQMTDMTKLLKFYWFFKLI